MANFAPKQWDQIKYLFLLASGQDPAEQRRIVESASQDQAVRREVERLLLHHARSSGFMSRPLLDGEALRRFSLEDPSTFPDGEFINGRFRIVRCVGRGGMGEIYEAVDEAIGGVRVALKTIRSGLEVDERVQRQFRKEVEIARRVTHPNVCRIYDLFECRRPEPLLGGEEIVLFLTMEFLDGESLSDVIARTGALSSSSALKIARDITSALSAAHQEGVIHRDLKASNVMLVHVSAGPPKAVLTDFGLAHPASVTLVGDDDWGGTPDYMAPEQLAGQPSDERSDIFSLGIVFYEMLAARRPFPTVLGLTEARRIVRREAEPLRTHAPAVDPRWEQIVDRCLAEDPASRPIDCTHVLHALDSIGESKLSRRAALGAALGAIPCGWVLWRMSEKALQTPRSLAILPFQNLSGDPQIDFLAQGLGDELMRTLSRERGLNLIAPNSIRQTPGSADLKSTASRLKASVLLLGGLRRSGSRILVNAQLADAGSGTFLWSGTYEEDLDRVGRLPVSLALAVVGALQLNADATNLAATGPPPNHEAYRLYLLGRTHASYRTEDGLKRSETYLRQSVGLEPGYAPTQAALAETLNLLAGHTDCPRDEYFVAAERAASQALALDPRLGEAHLALASILQRYRWDWGNAEVHFRRAIELNPGLALAHHWYAGFLSNRGRAPMAMAEVLLAERLDPLSPAIRTAHAVYLYRARHFAESIAKFNETLATFPNYAVALPQLAEVYAQEAMWDKAIATYRKSIAAGHANDSVQAGLGDTLARSGHIEEARAIAAKLEEAFLHQESGAAPIAYVYRGLGDNDRTFYWFDVAVRQQEPAVTILNVDPANDRLRNDARFSKLLERLRL